ncbi:MAG: SirA family protein [Deltaproteobacteria bacterium]|nr:SirA family protein [Deltaproteobacteria bacterium]
MSAPVIDCRGLSCPLPVIRVKEELDKGQPFSVIVDASVAVENISRLLGNRGVEFTVTPQGYESLIEVRS